MNTDKVNVKKIVLSGLSRRGFFNEVAFYDRHAISESRILNYDGKNVTFYYNAHEDESYHEVTISDEKFVLILLRHLLSYNFKSIRYYRFYRKKHKLHNTMNKIISDEKITVRK